jgi:hypothetical protein
MQDDVRAARRRRDRGMIERVDLERLSAGCSAGGGPRTQQAADRPAGIAERLGGPAAQAAGGTQHQDATSHVAPAMRSFLPSGLATPGPGIEPGDGLSIERVVRGRPMTEFLVYGLVPLAVLAVAVVLLLGLSNFARGGSPQRSQRLMRLRVLLQFVAIIVIMFSIWAMGR